jgi:hypothetical protein
MEFPISFFLDYAWNPEKIGADDLKKYTEKWSADQFGPQYATEIADIISKYSKYNGRRKPELLDANTYHVENYNEAPSVTLDYIKLAERAEKIDKELPAEYHDAFYQLVLHPVKACANLQQMYTAVALNKFFGARKNAIANVMAKEVEKFYINDSLISIEYNSIAKGKWNHMMDQTHIGYTYWQQPNRNRMPAVSYVPADSIKPVTAVSTTTQGGTAKELVPKESKGNIFYQRDGYVSIEANHFTKAVNSNGITWKVLPDLGRTGSAITPFPVTASIQKPGAAAPHLEYEVYLLENDSVKVQAYFSPSLNFHNDEGLRYAVSIDNEQPQIISINKDDNNTRIWEGWMANNIIIKNSVHHVGSAGRHTLKIWMINPGVVLQKIVLDLGGVKQSYLGPPETLKTN